MMTTAAIDRAAIWPRLRSEIDKRFLVQVVSQFVLIVGDYLNMFLEQSDKFHFPNFP